MKQTKIAAIAAIVALMSSAFMSCGNTTPNKSNDTLPDSAAITSLSTQDAIALAINNYLTDSIACNYVSGQVTIPCVKIVATDTLNSDDTRAWGDYWVFNYNVAGDTLVMVSGGSHPGLLHLRKSDNGYIVTAFDRVEDGSNYLPSAKRIFGEYYDAFAAVNSDDKARETRRAEGIAAFVKAHNLPVTMYRDYGADPVKF